MNRLASTLTMAAAVVLVSASTALAQTYPPSQSVEATSGSSPPGGIGGTGGTSAFTGSDTSRLLLVVAVLVVVGLASLAIARRRARALG